MIGEVWGDEKLRQTVRNERPRKSRDMCGGIRAGGGGAGTSTSTSCKSHNHAGGIKKSSPARGTPPGPPGGAEIMAGRICGPPSTHPLLRSTVEPFATVLEAEDG